MFSLAADARGNQAHTHTHIHIHIHIHTLSLSNQPFSVWSKECEKLLDLDLDDDLTVSVRYARVVAWLRGCVGACEQAVEG